MSPWRRFRFPQRGGTALLALLSAVTATIAVVAVVLAILAYARLDGQVDRIDKLAAAQTTALEENFRSRRAGVFESCRQREALKAGARALIRGDVPAAFRPVDCAAYVRRVVPVTTVPEP